MQHAPRGPPYRPFDASPIGKVILMQQLLAHVRREIRGKNLRMAERAIELHEEPAHGRVEERRAGGGGKVAGERERARIVPAMGAQESLRKEMPKGRRQPVAAVLAAQNEIISAREAHCRTRSKASWSSRSRRARCSTSRKRTACSRTTASRRTSRCSMPGSTFRRATAWRSPW